MDFRQLAHDSKNYQKAEKGRTSAWTMSEEQILGNSGFNEKCQRHYELKRRGYDLDQIAQRVAIHQCEIDRHINI